MKEKRNLFSREASAWFRGFGIFMVIMSHYAQWWTWFHVEEGYRELIRLAISKMGPYGVGIFFLFSGYGLAKSAGKERVTLFFVVKRIVNVYLPYLIIVLLIEVVSGGFESKEDFFRILHGQDFWYMTVIFLFYVGFMIIWFLFKNSHLRILFLLVFIYACNYVMKESGKQDFWYISNWSFAIGTVLAVYESKIKRLWDKIAIILTVVLAAMTTGVIYSGLFVAHQWTLPEKEIICRMWAVIIFTLFIGSFASWWKIYDPILQFIGKYSLYFYLTHTFLFMAVINSIEVSFGLRYVAATVVIIAVSLLLGIIIEFLCTLILRYINRRLIK